MMFFTTWSLPDWKPWKPRETPADLGRMILKRKQRANYQLIYKRRNRNLHIQ